MFVVQVYIVTGGYNTGSFLFFSTGSSSSSVSSYFSSTETLTAGSSEWEAAGALPSAMVGLRGVTLNNQFYVLGEW